MFFDVVCFGEALVDLLPSAPGKRVRDVETWQRCLGGAPANVAVGVSRLGGKSALVSCTGDDEFGHFIKEGLAAEGVDVSHVRQTTEGKTGLAFVSLTDRGERSFSFYRQNAAEYRLDKSDVDVDFISRGAVLHLGTNSLLLPAAREAAALAADRARMTSRIISCDPNLRLHIWKDPSELKAVISMLVSKCSVVKLSEEELEFVTGVREPEVALRELRAQGVAVPVVTLAEKGAMLLAGDQVLRVPSPKVKVVDSTGAGDGFMAGFLFTLTRMFRSHEMLLGATPQQLTDAAMFGCKVGSRVVQRLGAVAGLPRPDEL